MRGQGAKIREWTARAVHASPLEGPGLRILLLGGAAGAFLSFVGAFGSDRGPALPRTLIFVGLGLCCGLAAWALRAVTGRIPALAARPLLRTVTIGSGMTLVTAVLVWLAVGFLFLGGPRIGLLHYFLAPSLVMAATMSALSWAVFRPRPVPTDAPSEEPPRFLARLPVRLRGAEIYAVQAEDHYLRVHTSRGCELILMRLSDAIEELQGLEGARIHRSWWVARAALADARRADGRAVLKLKDGTEAPVSRPHARALKQAGWL